MNGSLVIPRRELTIKGTLHGGPGGERSRNEEEALDRLGRLLRQGLERPKARKAMKPTRGSKRRRLDAKRRRGDEKQLRRTPRNDGS